MQNYNEPPARELTLSRSLGGKPVPLPPLGSPNFPYLSNPDGSWTCRFCDSIPSNYLQDKSLWKVDGGIPPTAGFVASHMRVCPGSVHQQQHDGRAATSIPGMPAAGGAQPPSAAPVEIHGLFECYYCGRRYSSWYDCKKHIKMHMQIHCPDLIGIVELLPEHTMVDDDGQDYTTARYAAPLCTYKGGTHYTNKHAPRWNRKNRKMYLCLSCGRNYKTWKICQGHMDRCCPVMWSQYKRRETMERLKVKCRVYL